MPTQNIQSFNGNLTAIYLDGQTFAMTQSCRVITDYQQQPNSGVGNNEAIEYVPGFTQITVEITAATARNISLQSTGLAPITTADILNGNVFDMIIFDKLTQQPILVVRQMSIAQDTLTIAKHAINQFDATFMAIKKGGSMTANSNNTIAAVS